ncbi:ATP-binding protein [Actinoplanes sp. NPDC049681]|uniref:ATP-binding protein n=1 Tax=Actinoplanes sp. NPDC049681 TaxID=3363905 RepID=UPI003792D61D
MAVIELLLPAPDRRCDRWRHHHQVINRILWKVRTGALWRELPKATHDPVTVCTIYVYLTYSATMAYVVMAEDNPQHQRVITEILHRLHHETVMVPDGRAALAAIAVRRPDLVIADVDMPRLDGVQLCRAIRRDPELAGLPVLLVTAYLPPSDPELETAGATMLLRKPFGVQQLAEAVQRCLDTCRADPQGAGAGASADAPAASGEDSAGLLSSPDLVSALLHSIDIGIAVCDRQGRLVLLNNKLRTFFGEDSAGVALADWPHHFVLRHHDGTPLSAEALPLVRALAGETVTGADLLAYDQHQRPHWLLVNAEPIHDSAGEPIGAVAAVHDVSTEHQTQRYQRCKNAVLEALTTAADATGAATAALHAMGTWLQWPYVRLWLADPVSDRLLPAATFTAPGATPLPIPASITRGHSLAGSCWQRGEPIWVPDVHAPDSPILPEVARAAPYQAAGAIPVRSGAQVIGVLTYFSHDRQEPEPALTVLLTGITGHLGAHLERRRAEELAHQLAASIDEYVALVGHELRTPLTSITACTDLICQEPDDTTLGDLRNLLDVVVRNSAELLTLVDQLLDLVALESGHARLTSAPVDLVAIVTDAVSATRPAGDARHITLRTDLPDQLTVPGDDTRLRQVLDHLLDNAIKYSPDGATVSVTLHSRDNAAVLAITNPGAPTDEHDHLLRRLYRGSNARHQGIPGSGLGLTLSRAIIDRHHGTLTVKPNPPTGTSVTMRLPHIAHADPTPHQRQTT